MMVLPGTHKTMDQFQADDGRCRQMATTPLQREQRGSVPPQQRYDMTYMQCMYAAGNQIPGASRPGYSTPGAAAPPQAAGSAGRRHRRPARLRRQRLVRRGSATSRPQSWLAGAAAAASSGVQLAAEHLTPSRRGHFPFSEDASTLGGEST
jgi:hypothetical protein